MSEIYETDANFPFDMLTLTNPILMPGGTYFSKLQISGKMPVYIQTPTCKTKQGIIKSGKKMYSELMFTGENSDFIQWIELLESRCQELIYTKRDKWFEVELNRDDIESYFTSPIRIFKSGKFYLVRCGIDCKIQDQPILKIYDENENDLTIDAINENTQMITILEVQGIRCSAKSFQIELEMKQIMVLTPKNLFEKCIIKTASTKQSNKITDNTDNTNTTINTDNTDNTDNTNNTINTGNTINADNTNNNDKITYDITEKITVATEEPTIEEPIIEPEETLGNNIEPIVLANTHIPQDDSIMTEFELPEIDETSTIQLKDKKEMYYEMYQTAKRKAKLAKSLAISAFLEAKRIKNLYMLDDLDEDEEEEDDENFDYENQEFD